MPFAVSLPSSTGPGHWHPPLLLEHTRRAHLVFGPGSDNFLLPEVHIHLLMPLPSSTIASRVTFSVRPTLSFKMATPSHRAAASPVSTLRTLLFPLQLSPPRNELWVVAPLLCQCHSDGNLYLSFSVMDPKHLEKWWPTVGLKKYLLNE